MLRYGRLETPYEHFTVLADVRVIEADADLGSQVGPAWLGMKMWAASAAEAAHMISTIAPHIGAEVTGRVEVFSSEPTEPPGDEPSAYDPHFKAYKA